jgi:glycosyltransferase involved in cell wall biosynthesis
MVGFGGPEDEAWLESSGIHCWRSAPDAAMAGIYAAADLYVTATSWEGFDLPLGEAQAAGTPAVALRVGAHPEVVRDGETALLAEDMRGFEAAVRRLVADGDLRRRMGEAARRQAARFSWSAAVGKYARLVEEIGAERGWAR